MNLPAFLSITVLAITTGSMRPELYPGDLIIVQAKQTYITREIIAYKNSKTHKIITHRIVEANTAGYTTKGDANTNPDQDLVTKDQTIGRVIFRVPLAGYIPILFNAVIDEISATTSLRR